MKKIYLACPYSDPNRKVMEKRFKEVTTAAGILIKKGYTVFSPITHCHLIAQMCNLPTGANFWVEYDRAFLEWCDEVWVLRLVGHLDSIGVRREYKIARALGKEVRYYTVGELNSLPRLPLRT